MAEMKADAAWRIKSWGQKIYPKFRQLRGWEVDYYQYPDCWQSSLYECLKAGNCSPFQPLDILRVSQLNGGKRVEYTRYPVVITDKAHEVTRAEVGLWFDEYGEWRNEDG